LCSAAQRNAHLKDSCGYCIPLRPASSERRGIVITLLQTLPKVEIHYGHFLDSPLKCPLCRRTYIKAGEKMTDVNIATKMLTDAMDDLYDTAVLISGDSDLTPPIQAIRTHFPEKKVAVFFPPKRISHALKAAAHIPCGVLQASYLQKSQFPDEVVSVVGHPLARPDRWR